MYYFDRTAPLFISQEPGFDACPIDVDPKAANFIMELNTIVEDVRDAFGNYGAPEDSGQQLADLFLARVAETELFSEIDATIASLNVALQEVEDEEGE